MNSSLFGDDAALLSIMPKQDAKTSEPAAQTDEMY